MNSYHKASTSFSMSNEGTPSSDARSESPFKRGEDDKRETHALKRRKVDRVDDSNTCQELAPKLSSGVGIFDASQPSQSNYAKAKANALFKLKRPTSINLKNYPSNHHPVGIGIWILQKVEQARKELETQRLASRSSDSPRNKFQAGPSTAGPSMGSMMPPPSEQMNVAPGQEQEAERLQAQRNRKAQSRQENWAKSKKLSPSLGFY